MKPLELIWFENISAFNEPVLGLGMIRASMKQLLYTMLALALGFSLMNFAKNLIIAVPIAGFLLMLAFARPYGESLESLLIDMVGFFFKKKSIGAVAVEEKEKKRKERKGKEEEKEEEEESGRGRTTIESIPTIPTTTTIPTDITERLITTMPNNANLLHYIVPNTKDYNLEITDKEYVIMTGESTIHIEQEQQKDAIILITIKNGAVTDILVNRQ